MPPESTSSSLTSPPLSSKESDADEKLGVDEVLSRNASEFGPWQLRHFALVSLAWTIYAIHTMVVIFADREPVWWCTSQTGLPCHPGPLKNICSLEPGSWEWVGGSGSSTVAQWGLECGKRFKVGLAESAFFAGCMIGCGIFGHLSDSLLGRKGSLATVCIHGHHLRCPNGCITNLHDIYHHSCANRPEHCCNGALRLCPSN